MNASHDGERAIKFRLASVFERKVTERNRVKIRLSRNNALILWFKSKLQ